MNSTTLLPAVSVAAGLAVAIGATLGWLTTRLRADPDSLVERIDALLPQTQCGQCRHPGCRPYAQAIARGEADIDQCPPGGQRSVPASPRAIASAYGRQPG